MKRLREESDVGSQFKRPFGGSRGESQGLQAGGATGAQKLSTDDALQYLKEVRETMFQDQREKYDQFLEVMKEFKAQRIDTVGVIARVKELFKGHNNLIYGINTFLPKGYEMTLDEDEVPLKKEFGEAISFVNKIKRRFLSDHRAYRSFLDLLNMYRKEHKNIGEVYAEVSKIFEKHPDLLDEFKKFLPDNSLAPPCDHAQRGPSTIQQFEERSSLMHTSGQWRRSKDQKKQEKEIRSKDTEIEHETNKDSNMQCLSDKKNPPRKEGLDPLAPCVDKNVMKTSLLNDGHASRSDKVNDLKRKPENPKVKDRNKKKKYRHKSMQELDLSNFQLCTPSYRLFPDDYPIPTASQRSEIGAQVLNDMWVSVASGSEDTQFNHMRKNQYQEILFRCEEDMFELDMLLESVSSTAKRVEDLLNSITNTMNEDSPICIEEHFTPRNLRFIELLYGDHGLDVMDILHKIPSMVLPVILTRLKQKQEEWSKCRAHFNRVWAEVYAKNHLKSLDQRSFFFKQVKSLISEIKVMKENMQREDDALLAIAAGNKRYLVPHLEYEYPDSDIHEDLYKLVRFACEEVCATKGQFNRVMRLWTNFLEPLLGVQSVSHGPGSAEYSQASHYAVNNVASGVGESNVCLAVDAVTANFKREKCANIRDGNTLPEPDKCCWTDTADEYDSIIVSKGKCNGEPLQYHDDSDEDAGVENEVDVDDEDSENGSEAGDDASGSESAGDECFRDEHGEEEDAEHDEIDGKAESEEEADVMVEGHRHGGNGTALPLSERFLTSLKPVAKYISSALSSIDKKDSRVFYGNDNFYVLFRLHQILYERMVTAKITARISETSSLDLYARFVSALYNLLDGSSDNAKFEDDCLDIFGHQSYWLFTLDKLIYKLVKQLQTVASDEMGHKLLQLHDYENSRKPGKFVDSAYHDNARVAIRDENIYRIECSYPPGRMTIQLMDSHNDKSEGAAVSIDPRFSAYLHKEFLSVVSGKKEEQQVMMHRNTKQYAGLDEHSATAAALEGVQMFNGLVCKIACNTLNISYVRDTEDVFFRPKKKRKNLPADQSLELNQGRVKRFRRFLEPAWPKP